ncbi:cyclin-D3-1-like [Salvia hispanica]|uniref:cyclin-D3-1-like n=1 Tax=Salvia hispanica TaxID=49212 RepID=UPI002009688E|nr:cyclin-D3-1-like [Salvia hispanica]
MKSNTNTNTNTNTPSPQPTMAVDHTRYCEEETTPKSEITSNHNTSRFQYDSKWDDEDLQFLLRKDSQQTTPPESSRLSSSARNQAVGILLKIASHHKFSASAAVLAVNFVDRFLLSLKGDEKRPWLTQLVAVACLSIAAKVEETHVPLLVDLQVEDAKYLFEAKTIKRMELLILSALDWRMNPVTPLSFIDHFVRRLGFAIHLGFLASCEDAVISFVSDWRCVEYSAGVVASAAMLHVVNQEEYCGFALQCEKMMFEVLHISKMEVDKCSMLISDIHPNDKKKVSKRRNCELSGSWNDATIIDGEVANDHNPILKKHKKH